MINYILTFLLGFFVCALCWSVSEEKFGFMMFNTFFVAAILAYFATKAGLPPPR